MRILSKDADSFAPLHATRITLHVIRINHVTHSAVIKDWGMGNFSQLQQMEPLATLFHRKIKPKEIPSCLIPCLLVVFTLHLEILVTALSSLCARGHERF